MRRKLAGFALPSACDVRLRLRDDRNSFETHDKGGKKEDRKGECVKGKNILKCVAGFVARLKSRRKK